MRYLIGLRRVGLFAVLAMLLSVGVVSEGQAGGGTAITSCEQVVTTNAFLTGDLYCPGDEGVFIDAPGITVDLRGFTLRGDRSAGLYGIAANNRDGLTIKNGVIRNFDSGIVVIGDHIAISNIVATGNATDGITLTGQGTIKSSNVSGNGDDGFEGHGNGTSITATIASDNVSGGIYVVADSLSVKSVTAAGNQFGIGVNGDGSAIKGSVVTGNSDTGIGITGQAASLKGNRAEGNGFVGGASDLAGFGIEVTNFLSSPPVGKNIARGNDDPTECLPANLC